MWLEHFKKKKKKKIGEMQDLKGYGIINRMIASENFKTDYMLWHKVD